MSNTKQKDLPVWSCDARRPRNWRHARATALAGMKNINSRLDDELTVRTAKFIAFKKRGSSDQELMEEFPAIFEADKLYCGHGQERYMIEALICAQESPDNICQYVALPPEALATYEALFFDVRHRMKSRGYFLNHIMSTPVRELKANDHDSTWKFIAHNGGLDVLYAWMERGVMTDDISTVIRSIKKANNLINAAAGAITMSVSNYNAIEIQRVDQDEQSLELQRQKIEGGGGDGAIESETQRIVTGVDWATAQFETVKTKVVSSEVRKPFDEPRSSEIIRKELAAAGIAATEEL